MWKRLICGTAPIGMTGLLDKIDSWPGRSFKKQRDAYQITQSTSKVAKEY